MFSLDKRPGTTGAFTALGTGFVGSDAWSSGFTTPDQYGADGTAGTVWAVTNHNSDFTVIVVPEPGLAARRRRKPA